MDPLVSCHNIDFVFEDMKFTFLLVTSMGFSYFSLLVSYIFLEYSMFFEEKRCNSLPQGRIFFLSDKAERQFRRIYLWHMAHKRKPCGKR